jgi:hypothetical protein
VSVSMHSARSKTGPWFIADLADLARPVRGSLRILRISQQDRSVVHCGSRGLGVAVSMHSARMRTFMSVATRARRPTRMDFARSADHGLRLDGGRGRSRVERRRFERRRCFLVKDTANAIRAEWKEDAKLTRDHTKPAEPPRVPKRNEGGELLTEARRISTCDRRTKTATWLDGGG